jgi:RimK-like ATP-grasp domain
VIAIWGLVEDGPTTAIMRHLDTLTIPHVFIDQRRVVEYQFELFVGRDLTGSICGPHGCIDINSVRAIYVRPYNFMELDVFDGVTTESDDWKRAVRFEESMLVWCDLTSALVVNRPGNMGSNSSKPYQLEIIRDSGFRTPETLLTTDAVSVAEFAKQHGHVIYKSISSWRSIVSQLTEEDSRRLDDVACCPTQFQKYIEGCDYRVHVLNDRVFAHRIDCADDDYRYSDDASIEAVTLDTELAARCVALTKKLGLIFAGVDLRQTSDGDYYCFEVNPSPGFSYFDRGPDGIGLALAEQLALGVLPKRPSRR